MSDVQEIGQYLRNLVACYTKYNKILAQIKKDGKMQQVSQCLGTVDSQSLYNYVFPDRVITCNYDRNTKFKSFAQGYAYCARSSDCRCLADHLSTSVSNAKLQYSAEKKIDIYNKSVETCMAKYGVSNVGKIAEVRARAQQTNLNKYGSIHAAQSDIVKKQIQCANSKKYINGHHMREHIPEINIEELKEKYKTSTIGEISQQLGIHYQTLSKIFDEHQIPRINHNALRRESSGTSVFEQSVADYVSTLCTNVKRHHRVGTDKVRELDIYVPDKNIAIECNGSYWHSELNGKDKNYHVDKSNICRDLGIQLIHVWEHDWNLNQDVVKARLESKLGFSKRIYARKCGVVHIPTAEKTYFLEKTHIQGSCPSSVDYGLMYQGDLVAIMSFGKSRYNKSIQYELLRYASAGNIVGGAGRLFSAFVKEYNPRNVVSYADRMWNTGKLYTKLGFVHTHTTDPSYYYTKDYQVFENRVKYQKHKLEKVLEHYNENETEWQNMKNNGYDRIWDCGTEVYLWTNPAPELFEYFQE